jgi:hypothetical protein
MRAPVVDNATNKQKVRHQSKLRHQAKLIPTPIEVSEK